MRILDAKTENDITTPELLAMATQYKIMWLQLYGSEPRHMHLIPEGTGDDGAVLIIDFRTCQSGMSACPE